VGANCSCGEQIRDVRHKYHLTLICNLRSKLSFGLYVLSTSIPAWTDLDRDGLPVEETPTLKSAKNSQKVKSRD